MKLELLYGLKICAVTQDLRKSGMKKIKRALSLKGKGVDDTLSELAEQMSIDVNGKDNGELVCHVTFLSNHV